MRNLTIVGLSLLALSATACNADEPIAPRVDPLREVDIPKDFTFAMSRGLRLDVAADAALAAHAPLALVVSLPSGETLYKGPISAGSTESIQVLAPLALRSVQVKLTGRSKTIESTVSITGPQMQVELR